MNQSLNKFLKIISWPFNFLYKALSKHKISKNLSILIIVAITFFLIVLIYLTVSTVLAKTGVIKTSQQNSSSNSVAQSNSKTSVSSLSPEKQAELQNYVKNRIQYNLVSEKSIDKDAGEYIITISPKNKNIADLKKLGTQLKNEISRKPNDVVFVFVSKEFADYKYKEKELSKAQKVEYYKNFVAVYTRNIGAGINQISINLDGDPSFLKGSEVVAL